MGDNGEVVGSSSKAPSSGMDMDTHAVECYPEAITAD